MLSLRPSSARGHFNHGWLDTFHTFSFAQYMDPAHMGFRALRVMNEDRVAPGEGFGMHAHSDMEIVTIVLEGAVEHRDSLGNGEILRPGELQRMSAGTGIEHSEFNPSSSAPVHLYQIWLRPVQRGMAPSYEQKAFDPAAQADRFRLVASPGAEDGALAIHQDARLYLSNLSPGKSLSHALSAGRGAWLQVLRGEVALNGSALNAGDGAALENEAALNVSNTSKAPAELLLFDLA